MKKIILLFAAIMIMVALIIIVNEEEEVTDPFTLFYDGDYRHFRGNLFEAQDVEVLPNEDAVRQVLLNPEVYKVHMAFIPEDAENAFYLVSTFEITTKLSMVYRHYFTSDVTTFNDVDGSTCLLFFEDMQTRCFKSLPVNSTDEIVATSIEPVILLLGPSQTNNTRVTVEGSLITVEGADFTEIDRKYTDLDLAVDKMLLILMGSD